MEQGGATQAREDARAPFGLSPDGWRRRLGWRAGDGLSTLADNFERELAERAGFQWLAVAFGAGAAIYCVLPREPHLWALAAATFVFAAAAILSYQRGTTLRLAVVIALLLAGATAAKLQVERLNTPHVERPFAVGIVARVVGVEDRADLRPRITLDQLTTDADWATELLPARARVTMAERYEVPPLGATIAARGRMMPVPGPVVPGGYDPRRAAFFDGISGSGFLFGDWHLVAPPHFSADLAIDKIRAAIVERIRAIEPGQAGAVAAALLVGERSYIAAQTKDDLRRAGLAHVLAISGMHMMLVAGTVFFATRALLALSPSLALTRPIRKWAAVAALIAATGYLALSGGNVATIRAFVMAAIIFCAVLLDRPAISMRNLALAAFIVVALRPESVVEPGFQMSFGAVAALIAAWEAWRDRKRSQLGDGDLTPGSRFARFLRRAFIGIAVTTLVAGLATAPYAAFHFERVASYSLLGNLLAAPFVSVLIMPAGLMTLILMPFGLEAAPLHVMTWGIDALLAIAAWVAALPGAEMRAPPIAPTALVTITIGLLWLCLWRRRWRLLGAAIIVVGLGLIPVLVDRPEMMVAPDGKAVAVRDASGVLRVSGSRSGSYTVEQFFDKEPMESLAGTELRGGVRCDPTACLLDGADGLRVAHVLQPAAFHEDCARAHIVVTPLKAPTNCAAALVVDASALTRFGAHAMDIAMEEGAPVVNVRRARSAAPRPWQAGGN